MKNQFYKIINSTLILLVLAGCNNSTGWLTPDQADKEIEKIISEKYLQVKQVLNVVLRNVILNGRRYDKEVSSVEEDAAPPVVI